MRERERKGGIGGVLVVVMVSASMDHYTTTTTLRSLCSLRGLIFSPSFFRMSRLWRYGSPYTRVRDYIQNKFIAEENRPIWFDVWTVHPPFREPVLKEKLPINDYFIRNRSIREPQGKNLPCLWKTGKWTGFFYSWAKNRDRLDCNWLFLETVWDRNAEQGF